MKLAPLKIGLVLFLAATLISIQPIRADDSAFVPTRIPIGPAYAATGINASIFRTNSVVSTGNFQFVTYYDADNSIIVGKRQLNQTTWDLLVLPIKANVKDAHNDVVIGVSGDGILHLAYDHHNVPVHYRATQKPYDPSTFSDEKPLTGKDEDHVTYPQFLTAPDGTLYFLYRNGASGNGSLYLDRYDTARKTWQAVQHPLIDGENKCNPYPWRPALGSDGSLHIAWCWRDSPDAETNHDLCYVHSNDGGRTWLRSDGSTQNVPITQENAEVVDPIQKGSNLINQCSVAVDAAGHPHLAHYVNGEQGIPQYFHVWFDGKQWHRNQVSHRTHKFMLNGAGSLAISISRPEIAIGKDGSTVYEITRDAEYGSGIRLYRAAAPYEKWDAIDLTHEDLGNWEPTYDLIRLRDTGILSLFVLPVRQANHEGMTTFAPQEAALVEVPLP